MSGFDVTETRVDGQRVAVILPVVEEDAAPIVREGIARRRLVALSGKCPCGARLALPGRRALRAARRAGIVLRVAIEHEPDCPALHVAAAAT